MTDFLSFAVELAIDEKIKIKKKRKELHKPSKIQLALLTHCCFGGTDTSKEAGMCLFARPTRALRLRFLLEVEGGKKGELQNFCATKRKVLVALRILCQLSLALY